MPAPSRAEEEFQESSGEGLGAGDLGSVFKIEHEGSLRTICVAGGGGGSWGWGLSASGFAEDGLQDCAPGNLREVPAGSAGGRQALSPHFTDQNPEASQRKPLAQHWSGAKAFGPPRSTKQARSCSSLCLHSGWSLAPD